MTMYCGESSEEPKQPEQSAWGLGNLEAYSPLQVHYLSLLERLVSLRSRYQADPGREDWLVKAIDKAAYSSFRSCIEHHAEAEAKQMLRRE